MFDHVPAENGETELTECPTCAVQIAHGSGYDMSHPIEVLAAALVE